MTPSNYQTLPFDCRACSVIAETLIGAAQHAPDLTNLTIVVTEPRLALPLRRALLITAQQHGHHALLGPTIALFDHWLMSYVPAQTPLCDDQTRLLILVEALLQHPQFIREANPWALAENLLQLFDELTNNNLRIPASQKEFTAQLARGYRLKSINLAGLNQEASLVYTLWQAWHDQLQAHQWIDATTARVMALHQCSKQPPNNVIHFIGFVPRYRSEQQWYGAMQPHTNLTFWQLGEIYNTSQPNLIDRILLTQLNTSVQTNADMSQSASAYTDVLQRIYDPNTAPLQERAKLCRQEVPVNPLATRLSTFTAHDAEHEALAVDLQVRRWLWQGKQRIAIVTENRRLARRVRALLERADIVLQDSAGWALSTTRAAAAIESLLECIEEDFAFIPLLDLFKSAFIFANEPIDQIKNAAYHLERDIIRHEGVARGIHRYQEYIRDRQERLAELWPEKPSSLIALLQQLELSTIKIRQLTIGKHSAEQFTEALSMTLEALVMLPALRADAAGVQLLQALEQMHRAATLNPLPLNWLDFRAWLGRLLETEYFRPHELGGAVQLLNLAQAQWHDFDAVILAGAEQDQIPGTAFISPFFNDGVRHDLGLATRKTFYDERLLQFFRLLHSAPQVLITWRVDNNGEWVAKTPWVEAIESFVNIAYHTQLENTELRELLQQPDSRVNRCDTTALPARQRPPSPTIDTPQLPSTISYSDLQKLVDCPYHFYAARVLKLTPPEEVQLVLSKRDYGQRVHQCLQAFHSQVANLPGPFRQPVTTANRAEAISMLELISAEVFAQDMTDNFSHRGWYHAWRQCIASYIDWQIAREQHWQCKQHELNIQVSFTSTLNLKGQLDRLDEGNSGTALIDYKTGEIPSKKDVLAGEAIQLPFYALLLQQDKQTAAAQAEYLELSDPIKSKVVIDQQSLHELREQLALTITNTMAALTQHHSLPAWPHEKVCKYCPMETLCRKQMWEDTRL